MRAGFAATPSFAAAASLPNALKRTCWRLGREERRGSIISSIVSGLRWAVGRQPVSRGV
jgi:hypothetical protein